MLEPCEHLFRSGAPSRVAAHACAPILRPNHGFRHVQYFVAACATGGKVGSFQSLIFVQR